jgi:K+/H+ antiporter YhaU regulatory subunit KhtT
MDNLRQTWATPCASCGFPTTSKLVGIDPQRKPPGDAVDVQILCIVRRDGTALIPTSDDRFEAGDRLMVWGTADMISILLMQGLEGMFVRIRSTSPDLSMLEDDQVGLVEVMLSPHSVLSGMTLRGMNFREKYGLTVLAIWRKGTAYREDLRDMALQFGDALLLYGPWDKLNLLGREPDFLVLTETAQEAPREEKAKVALTIMAAVLIPVIMELAAHLHRGGHRRRLHGAHPLPDHGRGLPLHRMESRFSHRRHAAPGHGPGQHRRRADAGRRGGGEPGPLRALCGAVRAAGITFIGTSIIPTAALVVLMVPIALKTAASLGISPYALMMGIAMAASSSFTSPISHPANVLVMGPGGYRFIDYVKVGVPLTLVVLVVLMIVLPIFWPLRSSGPTCSLIWATRSSQWTCLGPASGPPRSRTSVSTPANSTRTEARCAL